MLVFSQNRVPFDSQKKSESEVSLEITAPPSTPNNLENIKTDIFDSPPKLYRKDAKTDIFDSPPKFKRQESNGLETTIEIKLKPREATVDCSCGLSFFRRLRHK